MPLVTRAGNRGVLFKQAIEPSNWENGDIWVDTDNANVAVNRSGTAQRIAPGTTAAGDVLFSNGASTIDNLAIGAAGEVLLVNSGGDAPEWGTALVRGAEQETTPVSDDSDATQADSFFFQNATITMGASGDLVEITDLEVISGAASTGNTEVCAYVRSASGLWQLVACTPEFTLTASTTEKRKCFSNLFNGGQAVRLAILSDTGAGNTFRADTVSSQPQLMAFTYQNPPPLAIEGTETNSTVNPSIKAYFRVWT